MQLRSGGDGHSSVRIYRRNGDRIERGYLDLPRLGLTGWNNRGLNSTQARYDPEKGCVILGYCTSQDRSEGAEREFYGMDAFTFEEYRSLW